MIRAVLDANVIVSAVLTTAGIPAQVLDAWRIERVAAILEEVPRVLEYLRIARCITGHEPRAGNSWPNSAPLGS